MNMTEFKKDGTTHPSISLLLEEIQEKITILRESTETLPALLKNADEKTQTQVKNYQDKMTADLTSLMSSFSLIATMLETNSTEILQYIRNREDKS